MIILANTSDPAFPIRAVARVVAGIAINKPYIFEEQPIAINELKTYTGLYENEFGELLNISNEEGKLIFQRPNGRKIKLRFAGNNEFFIEQDFYRVNFSKDASGKVTSLKFSKVEMMPVVWLKTKRPLLKLAEDKIPDTILAAYSGKYFLPGANTITITRKGVNLYYKMHDNELLLAAKDNTHFFALKDNITITFSKEPAANTQVAIVTENKKKRQFLKL